MASSPDPKQINLLGTVTVVVPCYNAGERAQGVADGALRITSRVVVADDGSTDACMEPLRRMPLQIISFPHNRGKGYALLAGVQAALEMPDTEAVCCLDADGQHDPAEIPKLFAAFQETQADLVIGARRFETGHVPWRSRFGNRVTAALTAWLFGRHLPDTQSGFRLLSRRFAQDVLRTVSGGRYETEMEIVVKAIREGYRVESVPISTIYEEANRSSHFRKVRDSLRIYVRLAGCLLRRPARPARVV